MQIDLAPLGLDRASALAALHEAGVGLSATIHPTVVRAVTHLEITDEDIDRAAELIPRALGVAAPVARRLADDEGRAREPARRVPDPQLRTLRCGERPPQIAARSVSATPPTATHRPALERCKTYRCGPSPGRTWPHTLVVVPRLVTCAKGSIVAASAGFAAPRTVSRPLWKRLISGSSR